MAIGGWRERVLDLLARSPESVRVADIYRLLQAEPFRVDHFLLGLEEEWLAVRQAHPGDRTGGPHVYLTPLGRQYLQRPVVKPIAPEVEIAGAVGPAPRGDDDPNQEANLNLNHLRPSAD